MRARSYVGAAWCVVLGVALVGCDDLLEVENPTAVDETEARSAPYAESWANGVEKEVSEGWDRALALLAIASDEATFEGPQAWWRSLDEGNLDESRNPGLEDHYPDLATGQWFAQEAITVLDSLRSAGEFVDSNTLARTYLYGAVIHATVADVMARYAPSDRRDPGPPLPDLLAYYDLAAEYASAGLDSAEDEDLIRDLYAVRARARHGRAVRVRLDSPPAEASDDGTVESAEAAADAVLALAIDPAEWESRFEFPLFVVSSWTLGQFNCAVSNFIPGERFATYPADGDFPDSVTVVDPIDGVPDPTVQRILFEDIFVSGQCETGQLRYTSAHEMRLISAENALARGDTATFADQVNAGRGAEGLTAWAPTSGLSARDLLIHERQTRLYMMGRRLSDLYRFGIESDSWDPGSVAVTDPGTLYPIPQSEVDVNCFLNGSCS